jgi:HlyD family secretion protein
MKEKTQKLVQYTKTKIKETPSFIQKNKKIAFWICGIIICIGLIMVLSAINQKKNTFKNTTLIPVVRTNLISTVKASGKVTSETDLELSFKNQNIVRSVNVVVGDKVVKGQILATLQNQNELGAVTSARGALALAEAQLDRTLEGATNEEVRVAQVLLDNANKDLENTKKTQLGAIENARRTLWSSGLIARPVESYADQSVISPQVFGTYTGTKEGTYMIEVYSSTGGYAFTVSGLSTSSGIASVSNTIPIGNGISLQFPANFTLSANKTWTISVPNKESSLYTTNLNTYESTKTTAEALISSAESVALQREAELALKKAQARPADVDAKRAEVIRAQGSLESALGQYENTVIRAPASGVITKVDTKPGELSKSLEPVIVLQDIANLYIEANINESNITTLQAGQPVSFTIDAFGSNQTFTGEVVQVEPGATITDGIVNYKIKCTFLEKNPLVKPGMNANLTVTTGVTENVLTIPGASITKKDAVSTVKRITNEKNKKYTVVEITTGAIGDGNMVEVVAGLTLENDTIALLEATKK